MTRYLLITMLSVAALFAACKKQNNTAPLVSTKPDSVKIIVNPVVTYPYTDTFSGDLSVQNNEHNVIRDTFILGYKFFVLHISADSMVFVSTDSITLELNYFPHRAFYMGYSILRSATYAFANYYGSNNSSTGPYTPSGAFYLSANLLQVNWKDMFADEIRQSVPTGGITIITSTCAYSGNKISH